MLIPSGVSVSDYVTASLTGARSHVRITFPNVVLDDDDIESSGITITSALNAETNLSIGKAVAKEIRIPILYSSKLDGLIWTSEFQFEYGIEIGNNTEWITLGYFSGRKPNRYISSDIIDFTAYDRMQRFDVPADEWLDSLTYPMTVLQMFKSLCNYCGVGWRAGDELPNIKARSFDSAPLVERGLTCRTVLALIAEACGCYARIDNDGYCKMVWFENHTSDYALTGDEEFPPVEIYARSVGKTWETLEGSTWEDLEEYTWGDLEGMENQFRVDCLNVKQTEDDIGVTYPIGVDGNTYYIVDNPYLVTSNQTEVTNYIVPLYTRLNNIGGYVPVKLTAIGCALIDAGDIINITAGEDTVRMPVFCKTMVWNGALTDALETTGDVERETLPTGVSEKLSRGGKYHKWKNTVDELYSELYDPTTGDVSVLQQTASSLGMTAQGIDIVGNKYVNIIGGELNIRSGGNLKIDSGGTFDVNATNFKINSEEKTFETGIWKLFDDGLKGSFDDNGYVKTFEIKVVGTTPYKKYKIVVHDGANGSGNIALMIAHGLSNGLDAVMLMPEPENNEHWIGNSESRWGYAHIDNIYYQYLWNSSSKDIKHNILPMQSEGERLDKLKPVTFVYDNDKEERTRQGLIYEDAIGIMPEICTNNEAQKSINYIELIPMLLKEIQELRARVKALEEREEQ